MDFVALIQMLVGKYAVASLVVMVLGTLLVVGQAVVMLTPSKKDDEAWAKIMAVPVLGPVLSALCNFAPIQKK